MFFQPKYTFYAPEFDSEYLKGMTYQVRPGNVKLAQVVERWMAEGRVVPVAAKAAAVQATVTGRGQVTDKKRSWWPW